MKDVISCSRRTDIPALYYNWLQERLAEKKITLVNPYSNKPYDVDLTPENIHSIILWSKNYANVLKDPGLLKNYNLYFQFTINGYSRYLEPAIPNYTVTMAQLEELCRKYSPKQINWRFDPIMLCKEGEWKQIDTTPWEARLDMFKEMAERFSQHGIDKCTFSFVSTYGKVKDAFTSKNVQFEELTDTRKIEFVKAMVNIAKPLGIHLYSCCEIALENVDGVSKSHCIDGDLLQELFGERATKAKDQGQRLTCGCTKSKDIGSYTQRCLHKCIYCYANPSSYTAN